MNIPKDGDGWLRRNTTPEIYKAYKEYVATGEYPYTAKVTDWIADKYGVSDSDKEQLSHEVYVASSMYRLEQMQEQENELKGKGFTPITEFDFKEGEKIILQGIDKPLRVIKDAEGRYFGMPPRNSRKGYLLDSKKYEHSAYEKAKTEGRLGMRGEKVNMVKEFVA